MCACACVVLCADYVDLLLLLLLLLPHTHIYTYEGNILSSSVSSSSSSTRYFMETTLNKTHDPYYGGEVKYGSHDGRGYEHCWSGDDTVTNSIGRLTINDRVIPQMTARMLKTAPAGADVTSWRY